MTEGRSKLILVSLAVAESAWLAALFSVLGLIGDLGGSPLPWLTVLGVLLISMVVGNVLGGTAGDEVSIAIRQSLVGLVVIYLLLGTGTFVSDRAFDIGWLFRLINGEFAQNAAISAVFGLFISLWLWRHGLNLGTERYPEDRLSNIFKIGIGVLAIAALIDEASTRDLGARNLLIPFFGATLVGMAVGRLPESGVGGKSGEWARIIGVSVFGIMGAGLLIGLLGGLYGNGGVRLLFNGWSLIVDGFLWVLRFPVTWATAVIEWLLDLIARDGEPRSERLIPGQSGQEIFGTEPNEMVTGNQTVETVLNILQYPAIVLVIIASFFILALAFRRLSKGGSEDDDEERESIRAELDTSGDFSRLLVGLVPGWLNRKKSRGWRSPDDPGVAEVFQLYFDAIRLGVKWGMEFRPDMTPSERMPSLQAALPGAPVQSVTDHFNAACYGRVPTDTRTVDRLREGLKAAEVQRQNS